MKYHLVHGKWLINISYATSFCFLEFFPIFQNLFFIQPFLDLFPTSFPLISFFSRSFLVTLSCTVMPHLTKIALEQSFKGLSGISGIKNFLLQDLITLFSILPSQHCCLSLKKKKKRQIENSRRKLSQTGFKPQNI